MNSVEEFRDSIESQARTIHESPSLEEKDIVLLTIERHITLLLSEIERSREFYKAELHRLLEWECRIDTNIMNREERMAIGIDDELAWTPDLRAELIAIERERRMLVCKERDEQIGLYQRLLDFLNKHSTLRG